MTKSNRTEILMRRKRGSLGVFDGISSLFGGLRILNVVIVRWFSYISNVFLRCEIFLMIQREASDDQKRREKMICLVFRLLLNCLRHFLSAKSRLLLLFSKLYLHIFKQPKLKAWEFAVLKPCFRKSFGECKRTGTFFQNLCTRTAGFRTGGHDTRVVFMRKGKELSAGPSIHHKSMRLPYRPVTSRHVASRLLCKPNARIVAKTDHDHWAREIVQQITVMLANIAGAFVCPTHPPAARKGVDKRTALLRVRS